MAGTSSTAPVVFITGCSAGGIGFYLAKAFLASGCRVVATARRVESMAELVPLGAVLLPLDVTSTESIKAAVKQAIAQLGRIDILVNNAGLGYTGPLAEVDLTIARTVFDANYWGLLAVTQAVVPHMIARRSGSVINIGSIAGWAGMPFGGIYGSSKAAVESLTHCLRLELRPFGVHVMLVCPGYIRSNIGATGQKLLDTKAYILYRPYAHAIQQRSMASAKNPTPTEEFTATVVAQALRRGGPPRVLVLGKMSGVMSVIRMLPYWLSDIALSRTFGLSGPVPTVAADEGVKKIE